jgi:hypothetical protein
MDIEGERENKKRKTEKVINLEEVIKSFVQGTTGLLELVSLLTQKVIDIEKKIQ